MENIRSVGPACLSQNLILFIFTSLSLDVMCLSLDVLAADIILLLLGNLHVFRFDVELLRNISGGSNCQLNCSASLFLFVQCFIVALSLYT